MKNARGVELNRIAYGVAGSANVTRSLDRNAELQLTLDRKDYTPGDTIQISIRAPYTGAGLITIERDKVYAYARFKTDKTASVQTITVPKDFEGTGYVNVHFVRDPASDEIYMSPLSYGIAPFATSLSKRSAKIELSSPDLVKPGQTVKIKLTSDKPTQAVVFAVDEGILQVARYKSPDPLAHFLQKRALEVGTQQTLDLILPEFKKLMASAAAPGGDAEGELGKHLNPFKRKRDKPVAFWSGLAEVNGSREFSYTVPESFNGSLRVMAVAVSDDAAGVRVTHTTVRGDMVILPNAPLAMAPGDIVEVGVGLANNIAGSGKAAPILLSLDASGGLEVVGKAAQTLEINERGEASTVFKVRAKDGDGTVLGSAPLVFTASYRQTHSAKLTNEVSVRPSSPYATLVQTGVLRGSGEIKSRADLYPNFRRSEVAISVAPWAFASGMMKYLEAYPHGCTEQITSQTWPSVLLSTRPELVKEISRGRTADQGPLPEARQTFTRYLAQLRPRQTSDGGFAMWAGGSSGHFPTLYATALLVEAKEHKLPVPQDMLEKANAYLANWLGSGSSNYISIGDWHERAQAAYLLTRQGTVVPAALANLRETWRSHQNDKAWREDLGAAYLAAAYQLVKQEQTADELMQPVWAALLERSAKNTHSNTWNRYYDPLADESLLLHLTARHFPARLKTLPADTWNRIATMMQDGWYNSLSSASVLRAVDAYFDAAAQNAQGKFEASAVDAQGKVSAIAMGSPNPVANALVPLTARSLKLANGSDFPLYYSWSEQGFERTPSAEAVSHGLEIFHEVLDAKDQPITSAKLGEEVTVRVRVRSLERDNIDNVALVDLLPGGLEPVLQTASDESDGVQADAPIWKRRLGGRSSWQVEYADIREDRVIFYGNVGRSLLEITYKARATNVGDFTMPPAYGEAMYDRRVFARSAGGRFEVVKP
ncbi:MAG: hypothetical protein LBP94_04295 [Zoogloeaceae bacterium]|nr:hypothetical protein [Zoogloeaceae bacterium]